MWNQSPSSLICHLTQLGSGILPEDNVHLLEDLVDGVILEVEAGLLLLLVLWGHWGLSRIQGLHVVLHLLHLLLDLSEALDRFALGDVQLSGNSGVVGLK